MIDHVGIYGSRVAEGLSAFNVGLVSFCLELLCNLRQIIPYTTQFQDSKLLKTSISNLKFSKARVTSLIKSDTHSPTEKQFHRKVSQLLHVMLYHLVAEEFSFMFVSIISCLPIMHRIGDVLSL